jgi:mRNA interferase MazF
LKRGAIWTAAAGGGYAGKPRPVVIVPNDRFDSTDSITVVPVTSEPVEAMFRIPVEPDDGNCVQVSSRLMVDKLTTIRKSHLDRRLGTLAPDDMRRVDRAMIVFLGLAG